MLLGPLMMGLEGTRLSSEERTLLCHPRVGGVILFSRNFQSPEQLRALTDAIHALRRPPLLIAVDQEGGRVQRFREGFTRLPAPGVLAAVYDRDPAQARALSHDMGWLMASELLACGVDFSFAPVLDLGRGVSRVIGDRAFHSRPEAVVHLARGWVAGMRDAGMAAVGKHFPGHGSVAPDSHLELPRDPRARSALEGADLVPFRRLAGDRLPGMMTAHVIYQAIDPLPATFSGYWIGEVLRGELGYEGAVFSDDLGMAAAAEAGPLPRRARAAMEAGCDMVLLCNHPEAVPAVLRHLPDPDPVSDMRLVRLHGRPVVDNWRKLHRLTRWQEAVRRVRGQDPSPEGELEV
ncbi:beta-N-acetylhexosaminidase [Alkalilimnicola ehrlichii MLHE-1]|uniref:Beta-hexosaminidase n=1 Tax=Alkalilimnicola ehrlichii (strain ATCC BAA-1101 / DSM 17681 / MLHE-1) TaxID=187272 RepID=NAGZ_ALKEH|nr:beta-N-acetylhexosaminidase [Alkalilimnicola ehrlichii]Q0A911.1 RecName: Full=Beta-hexosaminidase; AltName: Full=Beta-N-acetylhexosaminidase; AltName: Full=N-acetyl-beta-glucosaminidase [Alkalilimnicola ehrlichii MLHE-1]ABI56676.1 Beta-N-acetylhexosaminidase [Alkalilimnicola ehrlichii MLHE-1]